MAELRLTPEQQQVVENRGGTLLVSAAAGSGKTKVLVDRVISQIVEEHKNIHDFLIITFTNAAAAELRGKIADAISKELARRPEDRHLARQLNLLHLSQISTVHAFCGACIRQYGYLLEVPSDYRMLEEQEGRELLEKQLDAVLEDAYAKAEPGFCLLTDTLGAGRTDQALRDLIIQLYNKLMSQPYPQRWLKQQMLEIPECQDLTQTVWGRILVDWAKQSLNWLVARYDWAIQRMQGDERLMPKYLPCYETQRKALQNMLDALDLPWDQIAPELTMEYPMVRVVKYPDPQLLDAIKAVKSDGKDLLADLQRIFSRSSQSLRHEQNALAPALKSLLDLLGQLDRRFSAEKRRKNLLDFSDQEHLAIRLLVHPETGRPTEVAQELSRRFAEIMVDEYQDSNRVQELIFTAISKSGDQNRFLVGDVKQSIYGFRLAEPFIFLEKYRTYPDAKDAVPGQPRKLVLSKNFRSSPEILEAVNHVFATVMSEEVGDITYGPQERLYPGLEQYPGTAHVELQLLELSKQDAGSEDSKYQREAQWITVRLAQMLQEKVLVRDGSDMRPVQPKDIAILFRSRDPISHYSRALQQAGIPVASGGGQPLFEAPEVKVLTDLLRVLNNPHQDIPLLAVLCSPVFRLSNDQLAQIRASSSSLRFYDAMAQCEAPWCVRAREKLELLRRQAAEKSAEKLVWSLLHEHGLLAAYSAMDQGQVRRNNLIYVYQMTLNWASGGFLYLYQLLRLLDRAAEAGVQAVAQATEGVTLTTMHSSKGLEYPVVVLADLSRKFNFRELSDSLLFDSDLGIGAKITDMNLRVRYPGLCYEALKIKKTRSLLSEELRILYVAMTRPKDYLIMIYAKEKLENTLTRLRPGVGLPAEPWAVSGVSCLGDWVLLAALGRVEAGELFTLCGRPDCQLTVSKYPWQITHTVWDQPVGPLSHVWTADQGQEEKISVPMPEQLLHQLQWQDRHMAAARTPSKLTATQLKGREKDNEAAEGANVPARAPQLRRPEFILEKQGLSATERGTAVHLFLQYADFSQCETLDGIQLEKYRLEDQEFMTVQQLDAVDPSAIATLFHSPLGQRMLHAKNLIREFKFSILEDASRHYDQVDGEQVLLQGVVDAAIVEDDGLTVIDFKTDHVFNAMERAQVYAGQMSAYRDALTRIFARPVKEMVLYFLHTGEVVTL